MEELEKLSATKMREERGDARVKYAYIRHAFILAEEFLPDLKTMLGDYEIPYELSYNYNEVEVTIPWSRDRITVVDTWFAHIQEENGITKRLIDNVITYGTLKYLIRRDIPYNTRSVEFSVTLDAKQAGARCTMVETGEIETFTSTRKKYKIVCPD